MIDLDLIQQKLGIRINMSKLLGLWKYRNHKVGDFKREDITKILDHVGFETNLSPEIVEACISYACGCSASECFDKIQSPDAVADILDVAFNGIKSRVQFKDGVVVKEENEVQLLNLGSDDSFM